MGAGLEAILRRRGNMDIYFSIKEGSEVDPHLATLGVRPQLLHHLKGQCLFLFRTRNWTLLALLLVSYHIGTDLYCAQPHIALRR